MEGIVWLNKIGWWSPAQTVKCKIIIMQVFRPRPTHGYLGYPGIVAGGRRGRTLVLVSPCGGRPRALILHHSPHRLLPPYFLTPHAQIMTSGVHADLRGPTQCIGVRTWPQGVSVGHSFAAHACHIDLRDGHTPQRSLTVYTHFLGLWLMSMEVVK